MTSSQFAEWLTYSAIDPVGREYRQEIRHGQLMQLLDAAHFKRDRPAKVCDFMNFQEAPPPTDEDDFERIDREIFGL
jgi:hypothetical protein